MMKSLIIHVLGIILCIISLPLIGFTQSVQGVVIDAYSLGPIPNASIQFEMGDEKQSTQTSENGEYVIALTQPGRYKISIQKDQYQSILLSGIQVNTGRTLTLQHELVPTPFELEAIVVKANDTWSPIDQIQTEIIGIEETERIAANFQDPARVANAYAGVLQLNDQANHLVIRGLSPSYSKWYLEGMEIVNPNHTNNAGTLSDGPTQAGGGVNMFPTQILGSTVLSKGAHPSSYSNALGGILDMHYGRPDQNDLNVTTNISLIGVEAKAEGPFSKESVNSWQVNYRYSTIGLLSLMGVPLGDEDIAYQDLHFHTNFKVGERGNLQAFGFWGNDKNDFTGNADSTMWEFDKDRFEINYKNDIYGVGFHYRQLIGSKGVFRAGSVWSSNESKRSFGNTIATGTSSQLGLSSGNFQKLSSFVNYQYKPSNRIRISTAVQLQSYNSETTFGENFKSSDLFLSQRKGNGLLLRPNASLIYQLSSKFQIEPSLGLSYWSSGNQTVLEPGLRMTYAIFPKTGLTVSYQKRSQNIFQPLQSILGEKVNPSSEFASESNSLSLDVEYHASVQSTFKSSFFFSQINNAFVFEDGTYYSQLFDAFTALRAAPNGQERNYGVELNYGYQNNRGTFFSANATVYKSELLQFDKWNSSRFDGGYIFNIQAGKEFVKSKSTHKRTLGISARLTSFGGLRERPIDDVSSRSEGRTIYRLFSSYTEQLSTYFRPDISIYISKNKPNKTTRWYLDIQNVASMENEGFRYFDAFQDKVLVKNQLTIIPILGWRAEF